MAEDLNEALDEAIERVETLGRDVEEATAQVATLRERSAALGERLTATTAAAHERTESMLTQLEQAGEELRSRAAGVRDAVARLHDQSSTMATEAVATLASIRAELDGVEAVEQQVRTALAHSVAEVDGRVDALDAQADELLAVASQRLETLRGQAQGLREQAQQIHTSLTAAGTAVHAEMEALAADTRGRTDEIVAAQAAFAEQARAGIEGLRSNADTAARATVEKMVEAFATDAAAQLAESLGPLQAAIEQFEEWRERCESLFDDRFGETAERVREVADVVEALKPLLAAARVLA